jgi:aminopeptidase N
MLLTQKTENKSLEEYLFQQKNAKSYLDRREAIDAASKKASEAVAQTILLQGLQDKFYGLRSFAITKLDIKNTALRTAAEPILLQIAQKDQSRPVRAAAISKLGDLKSPQYKSLFMNALNDSSYSVAGSALQALAKIDSISALNEAKRLVQSPAKGALASGITRTMISYGDESSSEIILKNFEEMPLSQQKFDAVQPLTQFLVRVKNMATFKRGVDDITEFVKAMPENIRSQVSGFVENLLRGVQKAKSANGEKEAADYIENKLSKKDF